MTNLSDNELDVLVCVIDDDDGFRNALASLLRSAGYRVEIFPSPAEYAVSPGADDCACLLLDVHLQDANGLEFQQKLQHSQATVPVILMTGQADVLTSVKGMRAGAVNFLAKPFSGDDILEAVDEAVGIDRVRRAEKRGDEAAKHAYASLTPREREVMALVTAGLMNKQVAGRLNVSEITVKIHRGNMMKKMQAQSLADLVRMADALGVREEGTSRFPSQSA
ncbi:response regulator transcription factor [Sphingomonas faeni]|uniref:response regulator transcription factor n=1 Tax=Sphingomonas faeni TaxID=185950 RepID=UPI0027892B77|nr:LuxR C-terminal-related transcriptional regulator [Sphingomonas faeni]MDQ0839305.1 FixJ family two-component response regulator [Sphingomonas faeni]